MFHVSQSYGISESSCYKGIKWMEDALIKHPDFALPRRKVLLKSDIAIDATEAPIEHLKNKKRIKRCNNRQKQFYSGKKRRHTLKSQIVADKRKKQVIYTANGKRHDFRLFKELQAKLLLTLDIKGSKSCIANLNY